MVTATYVPQQRTDGRPADGAGSEEEPEGRRLASAVREALHAAPYVSEDDVDIEVRGHAVYLSGTVRWEHQRVAAERAVENLCGVHVLRVGIRVRPRVSAGRTKDQILSALHYDDSDLSHAIAVDVDGDHVTIAGAVRSYTDRQLAESVALSAPHARTVDNQLRIVKR